MCKMITSEVKAKTIKSASRHDSDTGSPEVQVSILTARIQDLTGHLKTHGKDNHSRRGLLQMIGLRKRLLAYLKKKDFPAYQALITKLSIRG
jgi:small subunit ribosomal protein S15